MDEIQSVATACWFVGLIQNSFCIINIQERELCLLDFIKYAFNIGLHQDICELICFKLGMMQYMIKLNSIIQVCMTLTFTEGHRSWES